MLSFFLLILCLNIDALSYGIAYGIKKIRFKISYIFALSVISTIMFAVPLYISKYIYMYFDELVLRIINAIVLIILGIKYIFTKTQNDNKISKNRLKLYKKIKNYKIIKQNYIFNNQNKIKNKSKINPVYFLKNKNTASFKTNFKQCFAECTAFSVDAIFTALLSGFSANYYLFSVIFYEFSNFLSIFCGNLIFYNINKNIKINLNIFSGLIFIFLGIFKMIGF